MSILIYIDAENGKVKKSAYEVATYARSLATAQNVPLVALAVNVENPEKLGTYGGSPRTTAGSSTRRC